MNKSPLLLMEGLLRSFKTPAENSCKILSTDLELNRIFSEHFSESINYSVKYNEHVSLGKLSSQNLSALLTMKLSSTLNDEAYFGQLEKLLADYSPMHMMQVL